jgi:hypothetical protein
MQTKLVKIPSEIPISVITEAIKQYNLSEGIIDRTKARLAAAKGAVSSVGGRISGAAKIAKATVKGDVVGVKAGAEQIKNAKNLPTIRKIEKMSELSLKSLDKTVIDITHDLDTLNIKFKDGDSASDMIREAYKQFRGHLRDVLQDVIDEVK